MKKTGTFFSFNRCFSIALKEVRHILRDPSTLRLIAIMPILMIVLFGFAVSGDIKKVPVAVLNLNIEQKNIAFDPYDDELDLEYSKELVDFFDNDDAFTVTHHVSTVDEIHELIKQRKVSVGLIIPARFSERFNENQVDKENMSRVKVLVDGADPAIARIAAETSSKLIYQFSINKLDKLVNLSGPLIEPSARERGAVNQTIIKNEMMQQKYFLIPAVISLIVFSIILVLTASTIVREKERGTIEQLMITPITKTEFILGKLLPFIVVGFVDILLIVVLANFLFGVGVAGSMFSFVLLGMLFVVCALGIGIMISTFSSNQGQSIMLAIVVIVPALILSGIVVPVSTMPPFVQFLAKLLPLTRFLEITRGIMIKGVGMSYLVPEILSLAIFAVVVILVSIFRFKKSLD